VNGTWNVPTTLTFVGCVRPASLLFAQMKVSVQARFAGIRSVGLTAVDLALERLSQFATDATLGGLC
jgi:hypothetical protein